MSEIKKSKKTSNRRPDTFRIIAYGLGTVIVLVCAIIVITIIVKESKVEPVQELVSIELESEAVGETSEEDISENVISEDNTPAVSETESMTDDEETEGSVEEPDAEDSETQEEVNIEEEDSEAETSTDTIVNLSDPAAIIANWETIPAGTVIDKANIDYNNLGKYFVAYEISDEVYNYINGKSYQENPNVGLNDLRYVKLLHYNFNHELQVGELIVAADLQSDYIGIFTELFVAEYEIQSMYLPDNYWTGDPTTTDSASIDVNNTSCFMYRPATGSSKLSKHSYGRAIDINPQQNPYVSYASGSPVWSHENANDYIDRTTGLPHVITEQDVCYQIFTKYGFTWGGAWTNIKDYQHFQK